MCASGASGASGAIEGSEGQDCESDATEVGAQAGLPESLPCPAARDGPREFGHQSVNRKKRD